LNRHNDVSGIPELLYESEDSERFLGVSHYPGFTKGREASCWAWCRQRRDGTLEVDSLIPIDLDDSVFGTSPPGRTFPQIQHWGRARGLAPMLQHPIRVPGGFLLASWHAGIIWVLKDVHPWPSHTVRLVSLSPEQLSGAQGHPNVLLGIQPLKDGNVLVAYRDEDSLREATRKPGLPTSRRDARIPGREKAESKPEPVREIKIFWKVLDPALGTLRDAEDSILNGAPTQVGTEEELAKLSITYSRTGELKITPKSAVRPGSIEAKLPQQ